jgi:hypothetical protein
MSTPTTSSPRRFGADELLRLDCGTGRVVGVVPRRG